jgi:hypothetical protein
MGDGEVDAIEVVDEDAEAEQPGDAPAAAGRGRDGRGVQRGPGEGSLTADRVGDAVTEGLEHGACGV